MKIVYLPIQKIKMKKLILVSILINMVLSSCATKKDIIYFQDSEELNGTDIQNGYEPLIEPNDILYITLSSLEDQLLAPYRRNVTTDINSGGGVSLNGFLVNINGEINYPGLGNIKVGGSTRQEITKKIKKALEEYITAAIVVDVRITNFKVTVIGEVNDPGVFTISNERITLPEALALAGDLSEDGNRNNIIVIREVDGKREVKKIDFTSTEFFSSSYYFLKQNDVVYVEPSLKGVKQSGFIPDVPALLALVTVILTSVILLTR
jgi:polysaccharide export outer membrane protein